MPVFKLGDDMVELTVRQIVAKLTNEDVIGEMRRRGLWPSTHVETRYCRECEDYTSPPPYDAASALRESYDALVRGDVLDARTIMERTLWPKFGSAPEAEARYLAALYERTAQHNSIPDQATPA